ncbi:unnamed protein product [Notodromas monacha]|uniref:Uncharacterized protein n=1 Tax=Notodromas monacha TaxID=399045 RepID=A0A7R9BX76_9CRUS|nr:unnamed protein product [Notodromas monacha]CAG0923459.1 unnamed protein product [Notodromas monacha]
MLTLDFITCTPPRAGVADVQSYDHDAEFVPVEQSRGPSSIEAVEVPAVGEDSDGGHSHHDESDEEGRQFVFPRVRIFRIPFMRTPPLFPSLFQQRRPSVFAAEDDSSSSMFGGGSDEVDKRVNDPESTESEADFDFVPPVRRPSVTLPSLSDIFGEFNRRMQVFEDEISSLFTGMMTRQPPAERIPSVASEEAIETEMGEGDDEEEEEEERPQSGFGFNLFRPFLRPFSPGSLFGFRHPTDFPNDYKNSTSKTEIINGTKVMVNETIHKGGDDSASHFVHFKVIHILPEGDAAKDGEVDEDSTVVGVGEAEVAGGGQEEVEQDKTEVATQTEGGGDDDDESEAVDLAHILPESITSVIPTAADIKKKDGVNPADFGYNVGDNEIDKTVEAEWPSASQHQSLPSGAPLSACMSVFDPGGVRGILGLLPKASW